MPPRTAPRAFACLAAALLLCAFAGRSVAAPLRVLTSFLPVHVFTTNVVGNAPGVEVRMMLPAELGCPHEYALTPSDMKKIAAADLFVVNGKGMEEFLGAPVRKANPRIAVVDSSADVRPLEGGDAHGGDGSHAHGEANPHTWVSPRNAILQVRAIERALSKASPANRETFRRNADAYAKRLERLVSEVENASKGFRRRRIVTFHNVFDYFARDAGLEIVGRVEETPGQEPSAGEIRRLVKTIREKGAAAIFAEPQYPEKLAAMVGREAGIPVRTLDPLATGRYSPTAYEDAVRRNLRTLSETLGSP